MDPSRHPQPQVLVQYGQGQAQTPKWDTASSGQRNGVPQRSSTGSKAQFRPPTLDEALPLSPLTSIVPFSQDILPFPFASHSSQSLIFPSENSRARAKQPLELLNSQAESANTSTVVLVQQSFDKLRDLLKPEGLTTYKFPGPAHNTRRGPANETSKTPAPRLTRFGKMIYENVEFRHRLPTPVSPEKSNKKMQARKPSQNQQSTPQPRPKAASSKPLPQQNGTKPSGAGAVHATPPTSDSSPSFVIAVPKLAASEAAEYRGSAEEDARLIAMSQLASKKRKRDSEVDINLNYDQQQKASAALDGLQDLIDDVVQAADNYQPDTYSSENSEYFHQSSIVSTERPILARTFQSRLEAAVQKAVSSSAFSHVPANHVTRLQKLCEGTVGCVERLMLSIDESPSDSELEEWIQGLDMADIALSAAKILLQTMTAGREEHQLYSEDLLDTILRALEHVIDRSIVPVIEARQSGSTTAIFKVYSGQKKQLTNLIRLGGRVLRLLGELVAKVDVAESAITKVEYISTKLIFVENAHTEKESVLGIQRFESMRRVAMDTLAKIFARHPNQRVFIFDEILMSLEKLPVTRQSARQYKLADGKPIQLVSALLMRLVQTSATWTESDSPQIQKRRRRRDEEDDDEEEESDEESSEEEPLAQRRRMLPIDMDKAESYTISKASNELRKLSRPLYDSAYKNATHVIKFMIHRALTSTKTGDQPYRNLLDIFTEDFLNVLGSPEWPASEMLLEILLSHMLGIMRDDKRAVPHKNLALDLLGTMGSGISDVQIRVRNATRSLESSDSPLSARLLQLVDLYQEEGLQDSSLIRADGPYRMVLEYLSHGSSDAQTENARGLLLVQWAKANLHLVDTEEEPSVTCELLLQLRNTIPDHTWLDNEYEFPFVDPLQSRLAFGLIAATSPFCKYQHHILEALLSSMNSPHSTLKSKSLKSVPQLLDKDPTILDRSNIVIQHIIRCSEDSSPLVRDSALGLLAKCIVLKPSLERQGYVKVVTLSEDENATVKKRAMKIMKDVFLRNDSQEIKSVVSVALLKRVKDPDEAVADLARQLLEDLWIAPFHGSAAGKDSVQAKLALQKQVQLIVETIQRSAAVLPVLEILLRGILSPESKNTSPNFKVCQDMVALMFDTIIDNGDSHRPLQQHPAKALTAFAKVNPKLFTGQQLSLLEPYVKNLTTQENLIMYRAAVVIFRHVLPSLSAVEHEFIRVVRAALMAAIPKVLPLDLPDTASCLWIIKGVLHDSAGLVKFMLSLLGHIDSRKSGELTDEHAGKLKRYIEIVGPFGKACDFDEDAAIFRRRFPSWKGSSVSGLIIDLLCPFTRQALPQMVRESALESIAMICQGWPQHYLRNDVGTAFELVFHNNNIRLQHIVLDGFKLFFLHEEKRSETGAEIKVGDGAVYGQERLAASFIASDNDGAATTIAQKFLHHILNIALATTDDIALSATEVIASINRQGLVHPKECGPALVALETSTHKLIASIAFEGHRTLHQKHESMFEKEYMKAVQRAFMYQKDIIKDVRGILLHPYVAKLRPLVEVLKTGTSKVRKRFLGNICARVDFELSKLEFRDEMPIQVLFARFVVENLAFFEYVRIDELLHLVDCLEKMVVAGTGSSVAHAIEMEILKVRLQPNGDSQATNGYYQPGPEAQLLPQPQEPVNEPIDHTRLRQLAVASMILTMVWEARTHLRALWGLQKSTKTKITIKDFNKAPTRAPFMNGEKFVEKISFIMNALETPDAQIAICKSFAELLSIDHELKISAEEEDEELDLSRQAAGYETPSEGEVDARSTPGSGKGKKRKSGATLGAQTPKRQRKSGTPKKGLARPRKRSRAGSSASADDAEYDEDWA